jgi:quercetin dioxygenase-like cupin family protein
MGAELSGHG